MVLRLRRRHPYPRVTKETEQGCVEEGGEAPRDILTALAVLRPLYTAQICGHCEFSVRSEAAISCTVCHTVRHVRCLGPRATPGGTEKKSCAIGARRRRLRWGLTVQFKSDWIETWLVSDRMPVYKFWGAPGRVVCTLHMHLEALPSFLRSVSGRPPPSIPCARFFFEGWVCRRGVGGGDDFLFSTNSTTARVTGMSLGASPPSSTPPLRFPSSPSGWKIRPSRSKFRTWASARNSTNAGPWGRIRC